VPVNPMVVGVMQRAVIAIDARVGRQVADSRKLRGEGRMKLHAVVDAYGGVLEPASKGV